MVFIFSLYHFVPRPQLRDTTQLTIQRLIGSPVNSVFVVYSLQEKTLCLYLPDKTDILLDLHVWTARRFH